MCRETGGARALPSRNFATSLLSETHIASAGAGAGGAGAGGAGAGGGAGGSGVGGGGALGGVLGDDPVDGVAIDLVAI